MESVLGFLCQHEWGGPIPLEKESSSATLDPHAIDGFKGNDRHLELEPDWQPVQHVALHKQHTELWFLTILKDESFN